MTSSTPTTDRGSDCAQDRLHSAAGLLYAAECAFHDANQTHVDAWVKAAAEKLHEAIAAHLAAVADSDRWTTTHVNRG